MRREQIVPIINALVNDVPGIYQVNIPNRGPLIQGFPEDLVVECQAVVSSAGIRGIASLAEHNPVAQRMVQPVAQQARAHAGGGGVEHR